MNQNVRWIKESYTDEHVLLTREKFTVLQRRKINKSKANEATHKKAFHTLAPSSPPLLAAADIAAKQLVLLSTGQRGARLFTKEKMGKGPASPRFPREELGNNSSSSAESRAKY